MTDEKLDPGLTVDGFNTVSVDRAFVNRSLEAQARYKERSMDLATGGELLLKHTDGHSLTAEEIEALYVDQAEHTKKLFRDLKKLQMQRHRAVSKARKPRRQQSKRGRHSPKVFVSTSSNRSRRTSRSSLPKTPKGRGSAGSTTIRFREVDKGHDGAGAGRASSHAYGEEKLSDDRYQLRNGQHPMEPLGHDAVDDSSSRQRSSPQRPHVDPLEAYPDNRASTEASHGAQYTKHAHMRDDQQMSTDIYGESKAHVAGSGHHHRTDGIPTTIGRDDDESSGGAGAFPPDPQSDTEHEATDSRTQSRPSASRATNASSNPRVRKTAANRHSSTHRGQKKRAKPRSNRQRSSEVSRSQRSTTTQEADSSTRHNEDIRSIANVLRTVQLSISELSAKMGQCTDAIRSLTHDHQKFQKKGAGTDLQTGEIIQQSINALSRNVQDCTRAVKELQGASSSSNAERTPGHVDAPLTQSNRDDATGSVPLDGGANSEVVQKLSSIRKDMEVKMSEMKEELAAKIDSTFADWLVADAERKEHGVAGIRRLSSVEALRRETAHARMEKAADGDPEVVVSTDQV